MNYAEMSDFQVNLAVAHLILGVGGYDWGTEKQEVYVAGMDGAEFLPNAYFKPCNSWADAGPIIERHGITLAFFDDEWTADFDAYFVDGVEWSIGGVADKNPLRAAMIVFLMMQEST